VVDSHTFRTTAATGQKNRPDRSSDAGEVGRADVAERQVYP
jgi:hypothetical protein